MKAKSFPPSPDKMLADQQIKELVDELGLYQAKVELFRPTLDKYEVLKREVLARVPENHPAAESCELIGERFTAVISARQKQRRFIPSLGIRRLFKLIGQTEFLNNCTFTLVKLDELTTAEQRKAIVAESQTGPRTVKAVAHP